jgi:hypothetical protein
MRRLLIGSLAALMVALGVARRHRGPTPTIASSSNWLTQSDNPRPVSPDTRAGVRSQGACCSAVT